MDKEILETKARRAAGKYMLNRHDAELAVDWDEDNWAVFVNDEAILITQVSVMEGNFGKETVVTKKLAEDPMNKFLPQVIEYEDRMICFHLVSINVMLEDRAVLRDHQLEITD